MATTRPRYQIHRARSGWYVLDTQTGAIWAGLVRVGARQLADRMNRAA